MNIKPSLKSGRFYVMINKVIFLLVIQYLRLYFKVCFTAYLLLLRHSLLNYISFGTVIEV